MAKATFDLVILRIGHQDFVVPKGAAFQLMEAFSGSDIYTWDTHWESGQSGTVYHASLLETARMPSVTILGPVQFHQAVEARREHEEKQTRKKAADAG